MNDPSSDETPKTDQGLLGALAHALRKTFAGFVGMLARVRHALLPREPEAPQFSLHVPICPPHWFHERDADDAAPREVLQEGEIRVGVIKDVAEAGVLLDVGGNDGLLHAVDISWGRVDPREVFLIGEELTVKVLKYSQALGRASLGIKQMQDDPWLHAEAAYEVGKTYRVTITSLADYGVFAELEPGVEGLLHKSMMGPDMQDQDPSEVFRVGQELDCQVHELNAGARRMTLSSTVKG